MSKIFLLTLPRNKRRIILVKKKHQEMFLVVRKNQANKTSEIKGFEDFQKSLKTGYIALKRSEVSQTLLQKKLKMHIKNG